MKPDEITKPCPVCKRQILVEYKLCLACEMDEKRHPDEKKSISEIDFFGDGEET